MFRLSRKKGLEIAIAFDISWLFQGLEDFKRIVLRNTIAKIFNVVLILTVVKQAGDVDKYTFILAGMTFVANISVWPYVPKIIQKVKLSDVKPLKNTREIFLLFIPTIAIQVNAVLDKTMIGGFAISAAENGYYEQTEKIVRMAYISIGINLFNSRGSNNLYYYVASP